MVPAPLRDGGDKNARGRVLVVAGSVHVPGAALLAGTGALRVGAGKVRIATCGSASPMLGLLMPEAFVIGMQETEAGEIAASSLPLLRRSAAAADAALIGPGMMDAAAASAITAELLGSSTNASWVIDAAAMKNLREQKKLVERLAGRIIVTPHGGEMADILNVDRSDIDADPFAAARRLAEELGIVVALKGATTHIVSPQGQAWLFEPDTIGLGTAGSGDALAGLIVGLLARGMDPVRAACLGVWLHGEAGNRLARSTGPIGYLAHELLPEIPAILADLVA